MRIWLSRRHLTMVAAAVLGVGFLPATPVLAAPSATASPGAIAGVGQLGGVYCTSPSNCWAVGNAFVHQATVNQVLHWNGVQWSTKAVPSPGGTKANDLSELFEVWCTSAKSCFAVGDYDHDGIESSQILSWNSKKWAVVAHVPQPGGPLPGDFSDLYDVTCTSAANCWAVGRYGHEGATSQVILDQALHWTGGNWVRVTMPNPAGSRQNDMNLISSIRCVTAKDCWVVGIHSVLESLAPSFNEVLHWDGKKWATVKVPNPGGTESQDFNTLNGLACPSATTCFAVGVYGGSKFGAARQNQLLRWNGTKWSVMHPGDPDGTGKNAQQALFAVTCTSPGNCWAAGEARSRSNSTVELTEGFHWNGKKWSDATLPNPGGLTTNDQSEIQGLYCATAANCWAVGGLVDQVNGGDFHDLILHRTTSKWLVK